MDALGYVCLLVVAVSIVALAVLYKKRGYTGVYEERIVVEDSSEKQATETSPQPCDQRTIYEFIQTGTIRACRCCDGENADTERFCVICGQDLGKKGA